MGTKCSLCFIIVLLGMGVVCGKGFAFQLEGLIEPSERLDISSQVPGVIDTIKVERGDIVRKGQEVAKLKSGVEEASIALAEARVEFGQRKVDRNEELFQKKLISTHERDEIATELKIATLELREAQERYSLRIIKSPVDGVVVERMLGSVEYVGENPIMTIARIDPLFVEVVSPVEYFGQVKVGMKAKVFPEAPVGGTYVAKVAVVDRVIDAASGTFGIRLLLKNEKNLLPAGLKCRVEF